MSNEHVLVRCVPFNRIYESIAGRNLCISFNDFRGMICRLPYDMSAVSKKDKLRGRALQ